MNAIVETDIDRTRRIATAWLTGLRDVTASGREPVTADRIELYANVLAASLPARAFTADTLTAVTRGNPYFPPVDVIRSTLADWLADQVPLDAKQSTSSLPPGWTLDDQDWLNWFERREREGFGSPHNRPEWPGSSRTNCLSLLRAQSYAAWQRVTGMRP